MKRRTIGIITALTAAAASVVALTQGMLSGEAAPTPTSPPAPVTSTAGFDPCYFVWATQDLPEVREKFQDAVHALFPQAEVRVNAYGENCVAADGSFTFGALETDFYVSIPVDDLNDADDLGRIVELVLALVIEQFPRPLVPGPQDGFVEFSFTAGAETRTLRASLRLAKELFEKGLHGAELLQALE